MWHEARRQEKKIRGMLVDYQRRAERRRDFYETIKADPTQFLQIHGRRCKIHLDPAVAIAGDSPANMMPWQNNLDNMIDRFDVRAHLDYIPDIIPVSKEDISTEQRQCNYESYRILAQNAFLGVKEEKFLQQLAYEEQFGITPEETQNKKKKNSTNTGAAIGYNYENTEVVPGKSDKSLSNIGQTEKDGNSDSSDSELEIDMDVSIDITKVGLPQAHEMNTCAQAFGMADNDFYSFLTRDADEAESLRIAREEEQEKAMFSGRKSRRERRQHKEKRLQDHHFTSFSFAIDKSPTEAPQIEKSPSRSPSPQTVGQITYITSFGDEEETSKTPNMPTSLSSILSESPLKSTSALAGKRKNTYADKVKIISSLRDRSLSRSRKRSRSRSRSRNRYRRSRSNSRPRSYRQRTRSPAYRKRRSRSRSRSHSRSKSSRHHNISRYSRTTIGRRQISITPPKRSYNRRSLSRSRKSRSRSRRSISRSRKSNSRSRRSVSKSRKSRSISRSRKSRSISRSRKSKSRTRRSLSKSRKSRSRSNSSSSKSSINSSRNLSPDRSMDVDNSDSRDNNNSNSNVSTTGPPIKKYYGRKKGDESSSELSVSNSDDSDAEAVGNTQNSATGASQAMETQTISNTPAFQTGIATTSSGSTTTNINNVNSNNVNVSVMSLGKTKANTVSKAANKQSSSGGGILNIQERLKRKMQAQLAKTLKADKKAEYERNERVMQQQLERDEEMREMAIKIRRRQRAIRHRYNSDQSSHSSDETRSRSRSRSTSAESRSKSQNRKTKSKTKSKTPPSPPPRSKISKEKTQSERDRAFDDRSILARTTSREERSGYQKSENRSNYRDESRSSYKDDRSTSSTSRSTYEKSRRDDNYSRRNNYDEDERDSRGRKFKPLVDY